MLPWPIPVEGHRPMLRRCNMQCYARDIMTENLIMVHPETICEELIDIFTENRISGVPVVNHNKVLIGVISVTDVLKSGASWPHSSGYFLDAHLDTLLAEEG